MLNIFLNRILSKFNEEREYKVYKRAIFRGFC